MCNRLPLLVFTSLANLYSKSVHVRSYSPDVSHALCSERNARGTLVILAMTVCLPCHWLVQGKQVQTSSSSEQSAATTAAQPMLASQHSESAQANTSTAPSNDTSMPQQANATFQIPVSEQLKEQESAQQTSQSQAATAPEDAIPILRRRAVLQHPDAHVSTSNAGHM